MNRFFVILGRWISLVSYGAISALSVYLLWPLLAPPFGVVSDRLGSLPQPSMLGSTALVVAAFAALAGRGRWLAMLGLRHPLSYPPLSLAIVVAVGILALLPSVSDESSPSVSVADILDDTLGVPAPYWLLVGGILFAPAVFDLVSRARGRPRGSASPSGGGDHACLTFDELKEWVRDDTEVSDPARDLFHHDRVAKRIAARLSLPDAPTIAVVGPLGSGKSTIKRLTRDHIKRKHRIQIVEISLWPFDSPEAAVTGILRALVRSLGRHTNILPLTGLPSAYLDVVERAAGNWGALGRLLRGSGAPEEVLSQLSSIAMAIDVRFVLWIEDLERFAGSTALTGEAAIERESERLNAVRALLYQLDRCDRVCVVISDTSLQTRYDLDKIARFVERPPRLDTLVVAQQMDVLREACLSGYPRSIIDPAAPELRKHFETPEQQAQHHLWLDAVRDGVGSVEHAIVILLETPRALKTAFRLAIDTWTDLCGEIDFDDLLVASVLRAARPDLFAFVDQNVALFQNGFRDPLGPEASDGGKKHSVEIELDRMLSQELTSRHRQAVEAIIQRLFPNALARRTMDEDEYIKKPQGVAVDRHANYWARLSAGAMDPDEPTDQGALESIAAWKAKRSNDLVERLVDSDRSDQIESFVGQFSRAELLRLLEETANVVAKQSAANWDERDHAPGIVPIWRMCNRRPPKENDLAEVLCSLMNDTVAMNLPLAHDLKYFFTTSDGGPPPLMSGSNAAKVDEALNETLYSAVLPDGPKALVAAINGGSPYIVLWESWGLTRLRSNQTDGVPSSRWPEMAGVLLDLLEQQPGLGVEIIAPFVTTSGDTWGRESDDERRHTRVWVAEFNEDAARRLFDFSRLVRLLAKCDTPEATGEEIAVRVEAAISGARQQLDAVGQTAEE